MESLTLRCWRGGGGGGGVLVPPGPSPGSATESWMWWVDFVCFFPPDIQLLRLRLLLLKLRLPWRPQDKMYMLVSEDQRSQIREITKFRLFTQFSYNWQLYYYTNCSYNATTKILSECFTEKVLLLESFWKYNERCSSSCPYFPHYNPFPCVHE